MLLEISFMLRPHIHWGCGLIRRPDGLEGPLKKWFTHTAGRSLLVIR